MEAIGVIFLFAAIAGAFLLGESFGKDEAKEEAVKAGVGEFFINGDNEKEFRWKQPPTS